MFDVELAMIQYSNICLLIIKYSIALSTFINRIGTYEYTRKHMHAKKKHPII